jgi:hypothetical protein
LSHRFGFKYEPLDSHNVADIDHPLENGIVVLLAHIIPADVDLNGSFAVLKVEKGRLAHDPSGHHAAGYAHAFGFGTLFGYKFRSGMDGLRGDGYIKFIRVGVNAHLPELFQFFEAEGLLLTQRKLMFLLILVLSWLTHYNFWDADGMV